MCAVTVNILWCVGRSFEESDQGNIEVCVHVMVCAGHKMVSCDL